MNPQMLRVRGEGLGFQGIRLRREGLAASKIGSSSENSGAATPTR